MWVDSTPEIPGHHYDAQRNMGFPKILMRSVTRDLIVTHSAPTPQIGSEGLSPPRRLPS